VHKAESSAEEGEGIAASSFLTYKLQMHGEIAGRMQLEHKLRTRTRRGAIRAPLPAAAGYRHRGIQSLEALLRWNDPESGLVMPGQFLPMLESSGLIVPVGSWVLARAGAGLAGGWRPWPGAGSGRVNVAALQIRQRAFSSTRCSSAVDGLHDPGYGSDIEITESSLLQDIVRPSRSFRLLRDAGIRVALDDFGTGYSFSDCCRDCRWTC